MKIPSPSFPKIVSAKRIIVCISALSLPFPVMAGWLPTNPGTYDYQSPTNWSDGVANGVFSSSISGNQIVTFGSDTTLANGLDFSYTTLSGITFQSDSSTSRTVVLEGDILSSSVSAARQILVGTEDHPLTLQVNTIQTVLAGTNTTMVLNSFITGSGSLDRAGGSTAGVVVYANNANSFTGNWSMYGGEVQYTSLSNAGENSALGAGSTITLSGNLSTNFRYTGTGNSESNRTILIDTTTSNTNILIDASAGNLTLTGTVMAANGANRSVLFNVGGSSGSVLEISGQIANQSDTRVFNISKRGVGTMRVSGTNNSYAGTTTVTQGTLEFNSIRNVGGGNSSLGAVSTVNNGIITLGGATLRYLGDSDSTTDRIINLGTGGSTSAIDASGAGAIKFTSDFQVTHTAAKTLVLTGSSMAENTISGAIGDNGALVTSLTKSESGRWKLTGNNTYTGKTTVQSGILEFSSVRDAAAGASALGNPTVSNGVISIGSGTTGATLRYIGGGDSSTNREIELASTTGDNTLDASGDGGIAFTSDVTATGAGNKTLILAGTSTAHNEIGGGIYDYNASFKTGVIKNGTGTWILSGTNQYSGSTTVQAGTLIVDGSLSEESSVLVAADAVLRGTGTVQGATAVEGTLATGDATETGLLTFGSNLSLSSGSLLELRIDGLGRGLATGYDALNVSGTLQLGGVVSVIANSFGFEEGNTFDLLQFGAIDAASFNLSTDLILPDLTPGLFWNTSKFLTDGSIAVIPEPSSLGLALLGIFGIAWSVRGKSR